MAPIVVRAALALRAQIERIIAGAPLDVQQSRIQKLLRGDPGTRVKLAIVRNDATIDPVTITRDTIKPPSVLRGVTDPEKKPGRRTKLSRN